MKGLMDQEGFEFFKDLLTMRGTGARTAPERCPKKSEPKLDYQFFDSGLIQDVLDLYIAGMPMMGISTYLGITLEDVDAILDLTLPFL